MAEQIPTVFIIDDEKAMRESLKTLMETVGLNSQTYDSGDKFLAAYDPKIHGCLVVDVRLPGMSGLELQAKLVQEGIRLPVIIITGHGDVPMAVQAMKMGALNFIEKPFRDQVLLDNIQKAIDLDAQIRNEQSKCIESKRKLELLTTREKEILNLLITGKPNKAIAFELGISQKTVDFHRANVLKKMRVESVVELVRLLGNAGVD
ncbi:MAG: response regulator transcription factor [Planctomycetota bacterium]|jgi:FixJ family two-component response regulator